MHADVYVVAGSAQKGFDSVLGLTDSMSTTTVLQMHAWFMVRVAGYQITSSYTWGKLPQLTVGQLLTATPM
jgi:hypothetical protein